MTRRNTAHPLIAVAAAAAASLILFLTTPADAQYCSFSVGFGMHGQYGTAPAATFGMSGYDPFVLDTQTGRFRYVPIPYDPEPAGSGYSPYRFNWHSARWDYVPVPIEQDYRYWRAAGEVDGKRGEGVRGAGGVSGVGGIGGMSVASQSVAANSVLAMDLSSMRATEATAVSRAVPLAPPPPPPRMMPQQGSKPTTRPTLARPAAPARRDPTPPAQQPARGIKGPNGGDADGWTKMRGVTGRWEYDYQHSRWIFVLPSD